MATRTQPTLADIETAKARLDGIARPPVSSENLGRMCGRPVWLKAENLQRTGSFKIRGAVSKVATLGPEERAAGVVTASAGNHGQAVAWAAREAGVKATIYMPEDAPMARSTPRELRRRRRARRRGIRRGGRGGRRLGRRARRSSTRSRTRS